MTIYPKKDTSFDPRRIPKALKDAGFSVPEVQVTAQGKVTKYETFLALQVPGFAEVLVLEGGKKAGDLKKVPNVMSKSLKVTGNLHPSHDANRPPGLTVEEFQMADVK